MGCILYDLFSTNVDFSHHKHEVSVNQKFLGAPLATPPSDTAAWVPEIGFDRDGRCMPSESFIEIFYVMCMKCSTLSDYS